MKYIEGYRTRDQIFIIILTADGKLTSDLMVYLLIFLEHDVMKVKAHDDELCILF